MQSTYKMKIDCNIELKNIINKKKQYTIPVFIPHFGCNNECVFCNQRKISGNIEIQSINEIRLFIENRLKEINHDENIQIAFFGGSFTGIPISSQIEYLGLANEYIKSGRVDSIKISTRPDYINTKILNLLKMYNVKTIELGVQSMKNSVLLASKRGHDSKEVIRASKLIDLMGFELGIQIMVGLPNSTIEDEIYSMREVLKLNPSILRIYPVYVIQDSELWNMCISGEYIPLTLEEASSRVSVLIDECRITDVKIIRIGLQSTDIITEKNTKILGPVSDNFAEYALSKIILKKIEKEIIEKNISSQKIEVYIDSKYISLASGPKKINKEYIKKKYGIELFIRGE